MEQRLQQELRDLGSKLESPPSSKDALLKLLKQAASCLSELDQSPSSAMLESMQPFLDAIVREELLKHQDKDVKLLVATCICEITRITAPEAPYNDDILKDIFHLIVGTFSGLSETSGPSFSRRIAILETVAKYRSCVVMLDLECDDLVNEMFSIFFSVARDDHPETVLSSMQTIMTVVLEESEDVRDDLLLVILSTLGHNRTGVTTAARQLAMDVIKESAGKLEAGIKQFLISSISGDNQSVNTNVDHHEVIYDVYRFAPHILAGVVPYLMGDMLSDKLESRSQAVRLFGDLFALPGCAIPEAFQPIFSEFLKRLTDRVATVRMSVLEHVKRCLLSNPTRPEAPHILSALCDRLLDFNENVRKEVVTIICDAASRALDSIPVETVKLVAERLRDKSMLVKKHTMEGLAEISRVYFARCFDGTISSYEFDWIPGKILRCFYDKDFRSDTIESVLSGFLYATESSVRDKIKHWIRIFSTFDKVEVKALEKILEQKQRLQLEMQRYLSLRQMHQDGDTSDTQKKISFCFKIMSRSFAELAKAEESFQFLDQLKDANIWKILTNLLDPNTSLLQASASRENLLRILGEKHRLYEFLAILSFKSSYLLFNKEHVKAILLEASEQKSVGNAPCLKFCMDTLVLLAHFSPALLVGAEEDLVDFLKDENEVVKEGTLHVLAKAGCTIREQLSESSSSIDLILERLCLEGSRRHAKYAVHALAAITKDDGLKSLSVLYKRLVDMLDERTNLPAVLQSLGCIAQTTMPVFETRESEIKEFIKSKILQCNNKVEECTKEDWDERSELCQLKIFGLKTLVKSYLPVKDAHLRPGIDKLLGLLKNLLSFGEIAENIASSSVDKAHLKLAAAKAVLRLSRNWEDKIPVDIFYLTLRTSEISSQARKLFLHKVHQYLKDRLLDAKYVCAFLFSADKSRAPDAAMEKENLADIIQMYQKTKARQTPVPADSNSLAIYPEYTIPFWVHALAHHFCPNIDECKDVNEYEFLYRQLYWITSMLVHKEEDSKSEAGSDKEENISVIVSIYQTIKWSEDVVDATKSKMSQAISDLGLAIIKRLAPKDIGDLQGSVQPIPLPAVLYKPYEKKEDDYLASEGQTWFADENIISQFESLILESDKVVQSEDINGEVHEDSEIDGNDVPLGKIIKRLRSRGSKAAKVKKNKSLPPESKETENDVDILKMVREINTDSVGTTNKFEWSNGHEVSPSKKSKPDQRHQSSKKRKAGDAALITVPKRRRSLPAHSASKRSLKLSLKLSSKASVDELQQTRDTTKTTKPDLHDSENEISVQKEKDGNNESCLPVSPYHKRRSFSSKSKGNGSDLSHSDEETKDSEAVDEAMENFRTPKEINNVKTDDDLKSPTGSTKKGKRKSVEGLAKCTTKRGRVDMADMIGYRVKVWWPMDKKFYEGTVRSYDPIKRKHVVLYQDGDVEVLNMAKERWEVVDSGGKPEKKSSSLRSPSNKQASRRQIKGLGGSNHNKNIVKIVKGKRTPKKTLKRAQVSVAKCDFTEPEEEEKVDLPKMKSQAASEVHEMDSDDSGGEDGEAKSESLAERKELDEDRDGDGESEDTRGKESSELGHEADEEVNSDPNDQLGKDAESSEEDPKRDDEEGAEESKETMEVDDVKRNESEAEENGEGDDEEGGEESKETMEVNDVKRNESEAEENGEGDDEEGGEESKETMEVDDVKRNESEAEENGEGVEDKSKPSTAKKSRKGSSIPSSHEDDEMADDEPLSKWKQKQRVGKARKKSGR